jgi:hypothetical protein
MEKRRFPVILAGLAVAGLLFGCSDPEALSPNDGVPPEGVTNESEAMAYFAKNDEFTLNADQTFADESIEPTDYGTFGKIAADIIPVSWGRFVETVTVTTNTTIEEGDSIATVEVQKDITGTLRILAKYSEDDTTTVLIEKPFVDHTVRNVVFRRVGREVGRFWLNWVPVATSLVEGNTVNPPAGQEISLTEIQLTKPNSDVVTITDPTNFYLRYRWRNMQHNSATEDVPEMSAGQTFSVRATVVSAAADTDIVVLRYGFSPVARKRMAMNMVSETANDDGTFTRVYEVTAEVRHHPGYFHAGVVAMTKKTLHDDDPANYSVNWWGVPYRVL